MPKAPKTQTLKRQRLKTQRSAPLESRSEHRLKELYKQLNNPNITPEEKNRAQVAIQAIKFEQEKKIKIKKMEKEMREARIANSGFGVASVAEQQRALELIEAIPDDSDSFEMFSGINLKTQMDVAEEAMREQGISGGGQKGGGLSDAVNGFIIRYITPAWNTARDRSVAGKNYVSDIALNYINKIDILIKGAGVRGPVAQQNLRYLLYGLSVLAAAYNLGLFDALPVVLDSFITLVNTSLPTLASLPMDPTVQDILMKIAMSYITFRYRNIPIGAYGLISSAAMPIFTALYARGDEAFRQAFPHFGENMAAGGATQLQNLKDTIEAKAGDVIQKLNNIAAAMQPGITQIRLVSLAWHNYINECITTFINGLADVQKDMDDIIAYYRFLENIGKQVQEQAQLDGVEIPSPLSEKESAAEIADLIGGHDQATVLLHALSNPELDDDPNVILNNIVTGAEAIGNLVSNDDIGPDQAAVLLLALGNPDNSNVGNGNGNGNGNLGAAAGHAAAGHLSVEETDNVNPHASRDPTILDITDIGGKARRRRHRKTAKKSHKKKHTKKHKAHKRKTTKTKKGKKSKRHTKRRS